MSSTADNPPDLPSLIPTALHSSTGRWLHKTTNSLNTGYGGRDVGWANSRVWEQELTWRSLMRREVEPGRLHAAVFEVSCFSNIISPARDEC